MACGYRIFPSIYEQDVDDVQKNMLTQTCGCDGDGNPWNGVLFNDVQFGIQYNVMVDLAAEPITLEYFKAHARIDYNTDDLIAPNYITAARQFLEQWAQLSFGAKTIRLRYLNLPRGYRLMFGPVAAITTPNITANGDILLTAHSGPGEIIYTTAWPVFPEAIRLAIAKQAAFEYMSRESLIFNDSDTLQEPTEPQTEAQKLLQPYMNMSWL